MGGRTLDQFLSRQKARNQKGVKNTANSSQEQKQQRHTPKEQDTEE